MKRRALPNHTPYFPPDQAVIRPFTETEVTLLLNRIEDGTLCIYEDGFGMPQLGYTPALMSLLEPQFTVDEGRDGEDDLED